MAGAARQAKAREAAPAVRAAEPARATIARAALDGSRSTLLSARTIQPSLRVSKPTDAAELEADRVAKAVVSMPDSAPPIARGGGAAIHRAPAKSGSKSASAGADPAVEAEVRAAATGGTVLPAATRKLLEPRMRASFAGVRIHTDGKAAGLSAKLGARAFTFGNHVFFGGGAFDPDSKSGMELIAHELTHTIQQGETIQLKEDPAAATRVSQRTPRQASRLGLSDVLDFFADAANAIPGYRMFTILIGVNPINMSAVEASAANILRAIVEFLPGGNAITRVLDSYGIFDKVGGWIEGQLKSLGISGASIKAAIDAFLDSLSWTDIFDLGGVWDRAKAIFTEPIGKIISFAKSLFVQILKMVQEAVMKPLAALAERVGGYTLLKAVMGKDPVTGQPFPRTPETVIGGFMEMIGQQELWGNIQRARAIPRAWAWFQNAMAGLIALVTSIPSRFMGALRSLEIMDFVVLPRAFGKLVGVFGNFLVDFGKWAIGTVIDLAKIIIEVVAPGAMPYFAKAGAAFDTIVKNPVRFVQTLVAAALAGFNQFKGNFLTHLKASLIGWVTGALGGAGVYIPQGFSLSEIVKFVLSVLGLTWANLRSKLVAATSETTVKAFETGFDLVKKLVKEGPAAAWQQIVESLTNLKEMVITQAMDFVKSKVVEAAVTKLLSMLSPAGAIIQAIIAIWNTIMFFKERISQIAQVAASFIDSIATIAAGNIGPAANRVEQTMAGMLTLVISFLARIAGLGKVSDAILDIVKKIRAPIDKGLTKAVAWVVGQAKKLGKLLIDKVTGKANRTPQDIERDVARAKRELPGKIDGLLAAKPSKVRARVQLGIWKLQYKLADLKLTEAGDEGKFIATVNPSFSVGGVRMKVGDTILIKMVKEVCTTTLESHPRMNEARAEMRKEIADKQQQAQADALAAGTTADPETLRIETKHASHRLAIATMITSADPLDKVPQNLTLNVGKTAGTQQPIDVRWTLMSGNTDPNRFIMPPKGPGKPYFTKPGSKNPGLLNTLPGGNKTKASVGGMQALATGKDLPDDAGHAGSHGELDVLMLGQEVARRRENFGFAVMGRDLIEQQEMTLKQMGRKLPAQPTGAVKAQEATMAGAEKRNFKKAPRAARSEADKIARGHEKFARKNIKAGQTAKASKRTELAKKKRAEGMRKKRTIESVRTRSVRMMTDWIRMKVKQDPPLTKDQPSFVAWIKQALIKRLDEFLKAEKKDE